MIVRVYMLAFNGIDKVRSVDIPEEDFVYAMAPDRIADRLERVLGLVYHYGQNDVQPLPMESVSMGDVIRFAGKMYVVRGFGFAELSAVDMVDYISMCPRDRCFSYHVRTKQF